MCLQIFTYFSPNNLAQCAIYSTYSLNSTKWLVWQWFSYIKVWSHWTYSSQNVGRKHLFLAQGEERRKKRGALESWSTEGTAISAWKGFEATVCGGVRGGGCLVPFIIPLCCFIHGGGTHHTLHCENMLTILDNHWVRAFFFKLTITYTTFSVHFGIVLCVSICVFIHHIVSKVF